MGMQRHTSSESLNPSRDLTDDMMDWLVLKKCIYFCFTVASCARRLAPPTNTTNDHSLILHFHPTPLVLLYGQTNQPVKPS